MIALLRVLGIPYAMATQHPDSATRKITANEEVDEAINDLLPLEDGGFGCDEKMVDYEGKLTPYHQPEWIVDSLAKMGLVPGEDYLVTPRIPAEKLEDAARQVIVVWSCLVANRKSIQYGGQAIKFMVHPMSETSRELVVAHRRISKLQRFAEEEIGLKLGEPIKIIPLVEDVVRLIHVDKLLAGFHSQVSKTEGMIYDYYRVFLGKSDASLAYGHLASSIALVIAFSRINRWGQQEGVRVYPIIGVGKPPFRGHLAPHSVSVFVEQYSGYYTVTIQSALRFDTPRKDYIKTLQTLKDNVGREVRVFEPSDESLLIEAARRATAEYLKLLVRIAPHIMEIASRIPSKRDRLPPEKYGRDISNSISFAADRELVKVVERRSLPLPRAIKFAATLYTIGLPPALIGLGRGLARIERELGDYALDLTLKSLPLLRLDAQFELMWYDLALAKTYVGEKIVKLYIEDIKNVKDYLGVDDVGAEGRYKELLWQIRKRIPENNSVAKLVDEAGKLRGFLG